MQEKHEKTVRSFERRIKEQDKELAGARREIITVRNQWFEVFGNLEKEFNQKRSAALKEIEQLKKRLFKTQGQLDEALDKIKEQRLELYKLKTELEEEKGRNLQLRAQMNRDYENSSLPSSLSVKHKKYKIAEKKQAGNPAGSPDMPDTAAKNRFLPRLPSFYRRHRKLWRTLISKKHQN